MYNFITNDWKDAPHQLTYDVRQPKTQKYVIYLLEFYKILKFLARHTENGIMIALIHNKLRAEFISCQS